MKNHKIIKTEISFAGGFLSCEKDKNQLPHVLEHMILAKFSPDSSFRKNGKTNNFYMSFSIESIISEHDKNLRKLLAAIISPNFDENELKRQKEIIRGELLAHKNNKNRQLFDEIILAQNEDFPSLDDQLASLENITLTDVARYYDDFVVLDNVSFLTSGGNQVEKSVRQIIASTNFRSGQKFENVRNFDLKPAFVIKNFGKLSKAMLVFPVDFPAGAKSKANLELAAFMLRERLYAALRSRGVIYRLSCYLSEGSIFGKSIFILECDFLPDNQGVLTEIIGDEIQKFSTISKKEFCRAKEDFWNYLIFNSQTPEQNNSHLRIRRFVCGEVLDWREFVGQISWWDFLDLVGEIKGIRIR